MQSLGKGGQMRDRRFNYWVCDWLIARCTIITVTTTINHSILLTRLSLAGCTHRPIGGCTCAPFPWPRSATICCLNLNHFVAADKTVIALIYFKRAPNSREIHSYSWRDRVRAVFTLASHVLRDATRKARRVFPVGTPSGFGGVSPVHL